MNEQVKKIPSSFEAETFVLGSIMIDSQTALEVCPRLNEEDFYDYKNRKVYEAIKTLYNNNLKIDYLAVVEQLKKIKVDQEITKEYVLELIDSVPPYVNVEVYAEIIHQKSIERELYYVTRDINEEVLKGTSEFKDLLESTSKRITDVINKKTTESFMPIATATNEVVKTINGNRGKEDKGLTGLDTGFSKLNKNTYGFQKGELIILAARPGVGKSAFALNVATNACKLDNACVAFFSLEMSIEQLVVRLLSSFSNIPIGKIRSGDLNEKEMAKVLTAKTALDKLDLYLDEGITSNLEDIKIKCRKLKRDKKLDLVIIDYLQLLSLTSGQDRLSIYERVTRLSRALKMLARELEVPILALSQLSRAVEKRAGRDDSRPILSDLRESGSIEQDADIVMFLHRKGQKQSTDKKTDTKYIDIEGILAKNRQGETTDFGLVFRGDCSVFNETE